MERFYIALHMPNIHKLLEPGRQRLLNTGRDADRTSEICIRSQIISLLSSNYLSYLQHQF